MSWQVGLYLAAITFPLLAFAATMTAGRAWSGRTAGLVSIAAIAGSLALSLVGFLAYATASHGFTDLNPPLWRVTWDWVALGGPGARLTVPIGIDVDNLTAILFVVVTAVALGVEVYSLESLAHDPNQGRFFAEISLFCSAMLGLVAAANLLCLFVCWELVGFCSYLLIGFWSERDTNARAAQQAFLINRLGDVGMLVAIGLLWANLGTVDFRALNGSIRDGDGHLRTSQVDGRTVVQVVDPAASPMREPARSLPYSILVVVGLGLFAGCVAKSAQFPLQGWLPDAMVGPTPASALIHAATMVAAGVYLVARAFPLFTPEVLLTIAYTGAITLLLAASVAMVQSDYKKVLAYSTVSQLGFMMVGLGVGGRSAGLFHLVTHAWFKATLFLGAGSLYGATHTYQMGQLGGLFLRMKTTAVVVLVATLAISGVPLFSGFASKDAILASSLHFVRSQPQHLLLFLIPAIGSALTAFYMFRMWFLIFAGAPRSEAAAAADEPGPAIRWSMVALAIPSVIAGWTVVILPLGFEPVVERWLRYAEPIDSIDPGNAHWWAMGASVLVGSVGFGLGVLAYGPWDAWKRLDPRRAAARLGPVHRVLASGWHFDTLYRVAVVRPVIRLADLVAFVDRRLIDGIVNGSAWVVERASRFEGVLDRVAVDRVVVLVAASVGEAGRWGRRLQTGQLRGYLMVLATAVVGLGGLLFAWILTGV